MNQPPVTPIFPPKRGLSPEEQKKVDAWIKAGKMKYLPAVGSKELAALEIKKYQQWLSNVGLPMKIKLGLVPLKHPERTEKERREHKRQQEREWHRKKREAKQLDFSPP